MPIGSDMGGAGFEPAKALPPDLQSGPFGRLGIHPDSRSLPVALGVPSYRLTSRGRTRPSHPGVGPRRGRAGGESRTHNPRFTKPMLCRLSYASTSIVRFHLLPAIRSGGFHSGREIVHYTHTARHCKPFPTLATKNARPGHARAHGLRAVGRKGYFTVGNRPTARGRSQFRARLDVGRRSSSCPRSGSCSRRNRTLFL